LAAVLRLGLTGGIGSGKSTVAADLARRGAVIIDGDLIAREIVEPDGPALGPIIEHFGPDVLQPDGRLNRPALAGKVFSNPDELAVLNRITHPIIHRVVRDRADAYAGQDGVVVIDQPLLDPEMAALYEVEGVVVVDTPWDVAVARLVADRGFSEQDAWARIAAQMTREERRSFATFVVDNGGDREHLDGQLDALWAWIEAGAPAPTHPPG
jgi:dephospho-CoA kinase